MELLRQGWCKGRLAKDRKGNPCDYHEDRAVSFCARGALLRAIYEKERSISAFEEARSLAYHAIQHAAIKKSGYTLVPLNDDAASVEDVIEVFEAAKQWIIQKEAK